MANTTQSIFFVFKRLLILVFLAFPNALIAQERSVYEDGYTSLSIRLTGNQPEKIQLGFARAANPLSIYMPAQFNQVNDSTYLLSQYTMGNTIVTFMLNGQTHLTVLQPNNHDVLTLHYSDQVNYTVDYRGPYKEIFDGSAELERIVRSFFTGVPGSEAYSQAFHTAAEFKAHTLSEAAYAKDYFTSKIPPSTLKEAIQAHIDIVSRHRLLNGYESRLFLHNRRIGLDSAAAIQHIPVRDVSYYRDLISTAQLDPTRPIHYPYEALLAIQQEEVIGLPNIRTKGFPAYRAVLEKHFSTTIPPHENLFYDMMASVAYLNQIQEGMPLSPVQLNEVHREVIDPGVKNYILHQNGQIQSFTAHQTDNTFHLPFQEIDDVLPLILQKYEGKVIVMDFWATWCGPCIEAFEQVKNVKDQVRERDDVVFLYLTSESSDYNQWNGYAQLVSGDHYYLNYDQAEILHRTHQIETLPSYLVFDKKGQLYKSSLGRYMGNDTLSEWIEEAGEAIQ